MLACINYNWSKILFFKIYFIELVYCFSVYRAWPLHFRLDSLDLQASLNPYHQL